MAKMNGFQRGLDSHPLYALDARSRHSLPPSPSHVHVPSGGLHYRSDTTQSCHVGMWRLGGGKVQLRRETVGFFARELRCFGVAVARTAIISLSLSVCLSVCLLQSAPDPLCSPNHRRAVAVIAAILCSPLLSSPLCIHMYLAPDTMDSEMAPLVDGDTARALDRKTEDDSGNGRRSERRKEGE